MRIWEIRELMIKERRPLNVGKSDIELLVQIENELWNREVNDPITTEYRQMFESCPAVHD